MCWAQDALAQEAKFDRSLLNMADFTRTSLRAASFRDATLADANFWSADVYRADFGGAIGLNSVLNLDPSEVLEPAAVVAPRWAPSTSAIPT